MLARPLNKRAHAQRGIELYYAAHDSRPCYSLMPPRRWRRECLFSRPCFDSISRGSCEFSGHAGRQFFVGVKIFPEIKGRDFQIFLIDI